MPLINCPNCGKDISEQSYSCMHCGFTIKERPIKDAEEKLVQKSGYSNAKNSGLDYSRIGKISIAIGCIIWLVELIRLFIGMCSYRNEEVYIAILNAVYFVGWTIMGGSLILAGIFAMIYGRLQEK
ncbi:zinc ribbon domain-containing protein [Clostridium aminobutyricum]|uniref:Zinc ribbon domain-containing protein n=1 Tax=Clostridium aminobutyricum TaxID=33953 RepID=A0A939D627_CLOAM|nr:zinc ribbon domain-containing protein [Clostridium aminobutyricum]MBN7771857.1 zinc ribbon domain-containing protein [Clostridium aminobutyricum]